MSENCVKFIFHEILFWNSVGGIAVTYTDE